MTALQGGQIQAEFRSISPGERTQLADSLKDRITVQESPWVCKIDLLFNTQAKPFDNSKIRQALSMAVDRWTGIGCAFQDHHRQAGRRPAPAGIAACA